MVRRKTPAGASRRLGTAATAFASVLALSVGTIGHPEIANACAFHLYAPEKTAVDWIVESDHLVAARGDPANAFAYKVVETLVDGGRDVTLTQLVDSSTRRQLERSPEDAVLFAFDAETGTWARVAYLSPAYRKIVDRVLAERVRWGSAYTSARFEIFEALQVHPDSALRALALQEIDKAPYEVLREIDLEMPVSDLLADLWTPQGYPYQSIRVLLLGLSGEEAARSEIHAFLDRAATWNWANNLGAYATALVEIDGVEGVQRLERAMLSDPLQHLDKLEQVVEALAIHNGVGSDEMRTTIAASLLRLVGSRPEAAPLVARQFGSRNDWSQAASLEVLVRERRLPASGDLMTVAVYVAQAKAAGASQAHDGDGERG